MRQFLLKLAEWWRAFWWGPPCTKHPGHRTREFDAELASGCAMMPDMCEQCWEEFEVRYR